MEPKPNSIEVASDRPIDQVHEEGDEMSLASPARVLWQRFKEHRIAHVSLVLLVAIYIVAIFCEVFAPYDPTLRDIDMRYAPPQRIRMIHNGQLHRPFVYPLIQQVDPDTKRMSYVMDTSTPTSIRFFVKGTEYRLWGLMPLNRHVIGTSSGSMYLCGGDRMGRDLLSRIIYGSRISLSIGLVGVAMSLILGILIGGASGYYGGLIDAFTQRSIDTLRCFPTIPLWLAMSAAIPATWSNVSVYFSMTVILALIGWTDLARVVRGKFLALREEDYITAAKVSGVRERNIILRYLAPAFLSHLIVFVTLAIPSMILAETSLSFLQLGLRPPTISWGVLLQDAQSLTALNLYPWLMMPAAFVVLTVLVFNFVGDGLRDAADPYRH